MSKLDGYQPFTIQERMDAITEHLSVIRTLFDAAESRGLLLWLESGWAIDARLGRITREHEDIDMAFASGLSSQKL